MRPTALMWVAAALGGVLLVAGVTFAAQQLSTQPIGLSGEPLSAGDRLAPEDDREDRAAGDDTARRERARERERTPARDDDRAREPREEDRSDDRPATTPVPTPAPTAAPT